MKTEKQTTGKIGEDLAERFLVKHGHTILDRNYLKKFGEIDVICCKDGTIHFVEVKSVSRETKDEYRAEDNIHSAKLQRIGRTIEAYLNEKDIHGEWVFDVITVDLKESTKIAKISFLQDIVI